MVSVSKKLKSKLISHAFRKSTCFLWLFLFSIGFSHAQLPFESDSVFTSIRVELSVDGTRKKALFDNGADLSVLFLKEKNELSEYDVEKETFVVDSKGNRNPAYLLKKVKIEIDELDIQVKQKVLAFIGVPKILGEMNVSFVLGNDIIEKYDWKIDFERNDISIIKDFNELKTDSLVTLNLIQSTRPGNFMLLSSNEVLDTFKIDFGNSNTLMTSNTGLFKEPQFVKIGKSESINGFSVDTLFMHVENNIEFADSLCVVNLPSFVQNRSYSNLIGLGFFIPFEQIYLVNSKGVLLLPVIEEHQYTYKQQVKYKNEVVSTISPFIKGSDLTIEIKALDKEEIELPPTKYISHGGLCD